MKDNKQIWTIIGITVIVALVVSLGVAGITGNVIKVRQSLVGTQVYTKAEVDSALSRLNSQLRYGTDGITYDMLIRLDKCVVIKDEQANGVVSCDAICKNNGEGMICVDADYQGNLRPCSDSAGSVNTDRFCKCCGL
ncbi:MAG: hypothetical protein WC533_03755 [Candidatus Pacearchaeota archaeon]